MSEHARTHGSGKRDRSQTQRGGGNSHVHLLEKHAMHAVICTNNAFGFNLMVFCSDDHDR